MAKNLRVLIFDETEDRPVGWSWKIGAAVFSWRFDLAKGVSSWEEALEWLLKETEGKIIGELHYWGHGTWGNAWIKKEKLNKSAFSSESPLFAKLSILKSRLTTESLIWFRTCSTFGNNQGKEFAEQAAAFFNCRVAAHTFIIGFWHSGLHSLKPGQKANWPADEGVQKLSDGSEKPVWATSTSPHTIWFLRSTIPNGW